MPRVGLFRPSEFSDGKDSIQGTQTLATSSSLAPSGSLTGLCAEVKHITDTMLDQGLSTQHLAGVIDMVQVIMLVTVASRQLLPHCCSWQTAPASGCMSK